MSVKATPCNDEMLFCFSNEYMGKDPTEKCTEGLNSITDGLTHVCIYVCHQDCTAVMYVQEDLLTKRTGEM